MCGIVGYFGNKPAKDFLLDGLSKLEYRGYDSAGIAIVEDDSVTVVKHKGRLANLEGMLKNKAVEGSIGIGHTRWATHGEPSDINSHPHKSSKSDITVVHNGIIENYLELRDWLKGEGYHFSSETDTEVIPNLIDYYYEGDLFEAVTDIRDAGFNGKPYPDAFMAALKKSGSTIENTLFLDDMQKYTDGWVALGGTAVLIGSPNGKPLADDAESMIKARAANKTGKTGKTIRMKSIYEIKDIL